MTVKEMLDMLDDPKEVNLSWDGTLVYFNFRNEIEVNVWGDYIVKKLCAVKEGVVEFVLAALPVKKGATA